jgi:anti-sigma regulatory factor (Ser/Thr protein kinase)
MSNSDSLHFEFNVDGENFASAGTASETVKNTLKKLGVPPATVRRAAISMYEGEINMVIHARGGKAIVDISPTAIDIQLVDEGPGIADIELAMREGYSTAPEEIRMLGFGAGMGLSNMKKYTDEMKIESEVGKGTKVLLKIFL